MEQPLYKVISGIVAELSPLYGEGEAKAMARLIFENLKGWTPVDLAVRANEDVTDFLQNRIAGVLQRLKAYEPIQYVFGNAWFYGMNLEVSPATLVPRPETAELVDFIVKDFGERKDLRVIDLGTGSGCIALALSRNLPFSQVTALDFSADALAVARANGKKLHAQVRWVEGNMLTLTSAPPREIEGENFDIIVSNPPYIAEKEKAGMEPNVLRYEPESALFVPDNDPLEFYRAILEYADNALAQGGYLYFEINPLFVSELQNLCRREGFADLTTMRDSFGKYRFLRAGR